MSSQFNSGRLFSRSKMGAPLCLQWRDGVCSRENYCFNRHFYNETDIKKPASGPSTKYSGESSFIFSSPLVVKTKTVTESMRKEEVDLETGRTRCWIEDTSRDLIDITGQDSPAVAKERVSRIKDTPARDLEIPLSNNNKVDNCLLQDEDYDKTFNVEANEGIKTNKNENISLGQTASVQFGKIYVSAPFALKPFEKYFSTEQIHGHFEQFGHIVVIDHPIDKASKQKDGFFFVTFEDDKVAKNLISVGSTIIKGFELIIKPVYVDYGKIFVGAPFILKPLDKYISTDQIYGHFGQFGNIISIYQPINRATHEKEGYFFVTFNNHEVANNLINVGETFINGFRLKIEKTRRANSTFENEFSSSNSIGHNARGYHGNGFNSDREGGFQSDDKGFDDSRENGSARGGTFAGRYNHGGECARYGTEQHAGGRGPSSSYSGGYTVGLGGYRGGLGGYRGARSFGGYGGGFGGYRGGFEECEDRSSSSVVCDYEMVYEQRCIWESIRSRYKVEDAFNRRRGFRYMPY